MSDNQNPGSTEENSTPANQPKGVGIFLLSSFVLLVALSLLIALWKQKPPYVVGLYSLIAMVMLLVCIPVKVATHSG